MAGLSLFDLQIAGTSLVRACCRSDENRRERQCGDKPRKSCLRKTHGTTDYDAPSSDAAGIVAGEETTARADSSSEGAGTSSVYLARIAS